MKFPIFTVLTISLVMLCSFALAQELELIATLELTDVTAYGIDVQDNYAYVSCYSQSDSVLKVIDVSTPFSPVLLSSGDTTELEFGQDIQVKKGFAYIADNYFRLQIFDIHSPLRPRPMSILPLGTHAHNLFISGTLAYIANCCNGLVVVNISDPRYPTIIGQYLYDENTFAEAVYVVNPYAYIVTLDGEFIVVNISDPNHPEFVSVCFGISSFYDIKVSGNYAYTSQIQYGVEIFDISNPLNPISVSSMNLDGSPLGLYLYNQYLFVASSSYLIMLDISNPEIPEIVSQLDAYYCLDVKVINELAYTCGYSYLKIYSFISTDISNNNQSIPINIEAFGNYPNPFNASTMISFNLPEPAHITLDIYDILGRKVETLINTKQPVGYCQTIWNAEDIPSGIYFYRLQAGDHTETKKMVLLK